MLDFLLLAAEPAGVDHDGRTVNMTIESFPAPAAQVDMLMILGLGALILLGVVLMNLQVLRRTWPAQQWDWMWLLKAKLYFLPVLAAVILFGVVQTREIRLSRPPAPELREALPDNFIGLESDHPLKEDLPEWVHLREVQQLQSDRALFVLSSQMRTSVAEADQQVHDRIKELIRGRQSPISLHRGEFQIPDEIVSTQAIKRRVIEVNRIDFGGDLGVQPMYRVHAQVELSPELQQAVYPYWKQQELKHRLSLFGTALVVGFIVLTAAYVFLRSTGPGSESRLWVRLGTMFAASALIVSLSLLNFGVLLRF